MSDFEEPLLEAGGFIDRISITLRICGDALDPQEVSQILNCEPTESWRKGDVHVIGSTPGKRKFGMWMLSEPQFPGHEFSIRLHRILNRVPNDPDLWSRLRSRYDIDLFCGVFLDQWNRGFEIPVVLMRQLVDRQLPIAFDIYCVPDDHHDPDRDP